MASNMAADSYRVYGRTLNSLIFITQSLRSSEQYDLLLIDSTFIVSFICFVKFILYYGDLLIVCVCYRFRVCCSNCNCSFDLIIMN